jgi:hypothetical protein
MIRGLIGAFPALVLIVIGMLFVALPWRWAHYIALRLAAAASWCIGADFFGGN